MPDMIRDGVGKGYLAQVDVENRLDVYSTMESEISHESEVNNRAFTWTHQYDSDDGDTIMLLKNTSSTLNLIIQAMVVGVTDTTNFTLHNPSNTTLAGSTITGTNLNLGSALSADASCYGDETGNTTGTVLMYGRFTADMAATVEFEGSIILGTSNELALNIASGSNTSVTFIGYYHEVE